MALGFANRIREGGLGKDPLRGTKVLRRYDDQWNPIHTMGKPLAQDFVPRAGDFFWPRRVRALDGRPWRVGRGVFPGFR